MKQIKCMGALASSLALGVLLLGALNTTLAQPFTGHYPAGVEGIKAGSVPPPGFYTRDYNYFYFANRFNAGPPDFDVTVYANVLRNIWITPWKVLGADYGVDVIVPFIYTDVKVGTPGGPVKSSKFGVGDIYVEPVLLAWHWQKADLGVGYSFWAPVGSTTDMADPGKGFWSHMITLGGTWYPDAEKTWAVSALNRYEIHGEHKDLLITPGNSYTLEMGLSKSVTKTVDVGLIGYYQQQVTKDSTGGSTALDRVFAVGPEVSVVIPKIMLFVSARYAREFGAKERTEGNTVTITLTKRW